MWAADVSTSRTGEIKTYAKTFESTIASTGKGQGHCQLPDPYRSQPAFGSGNRVGSLGRHEIQLRHEHEKGRVDGLELFPKLIGL